MRNRNWILACSITLTILLTANASAFLSKTPNTNPFTSPKIVKIKGIEANSDLGYCVSAGDINGDGFSDVMMTGFSYSGLLGTSSIVYVLYGGKGATFNVDLKKLTASQGFKITSGSALTYSPRFQVNSAGDVNGDGVDDIIIGSYSSNPSGRTGAGTTYIIFGSKVRLGDIDVRKLTSKQGFTISGANDGDMLGMSVSSTGDFNGDGIADIVIGAYNAKPAGCNCTGAVYVIYGSKQGFSNIDLKNLSANQGFEIISSNSADGTGNAVSHAGDVNGDGIGDLVIGGCFSNPLGRNYAGSAYIIYGSKQGFSNMDLKQITAAQGLHIVGANNNDRLGYSVDAAGDVNGDGIDDVLIGAYCASPLGRNCSGAAYVIYGTKSGFSQQLDLNSFNSAQGFRIMGYRAYDQLGYSVSWAGDVNGDKIDDVVVGAPLTNQSGVDTSGAAYVIFGSKSGLSDINVGNLSPSQGIFAGGNYTNDYYGSSVSGTGDLDGDGVNDVVIGAKWVGDTFHEGGAVFILLSMNSNEEEISSDFI